MANQYLALRNSDIQDEGAIHVLESEAIGEAKTLLNSKSGEQVVIYKAIKIVKLLTPPIKIIPFE